MTLETILSIGRPFVKTDEDFYQEAHRIFLEARVHNWSNREVRRAWRRFKTRTRQLAPIASQEELDLGSKIERDRNPKSFPVGMLVAIRQLVTPDEWTMLVEYSEGRADAPEETLNKIRQHVG